MLDQKVAGYLFLCSNRTQSECLQKRLFGLGRKYWGWVQQIVTGSPLFLYNIDSKTLLGPFQAASEGRLNIDPRAWENMRPLEFAAQVSVKWEKIHELETAYKKFPFLRDVYLCKLTLDQTGSLINALSQAPLYSIVPP
jgi:hypothetical protein